jgi:hypothetical protein
MKQLAEQVFKTTQSRLIAGIDTISNDDLSADGLLLLVAGVSLFFTALISDFTFAIFTLHFLKLTAAIFIVDFIVSIFVQKGKRTNRDNLCNSISSAIIFLIPVIVVSVVYS